MLNLRLCGKLNYLMGEENFGLRKRKRTRDIIGFLRTIWERHLEKNRSVFAFFIDFENAFDRVNWSELMNTLKKNEIYWID